MSLQAPLISLGMPVYNGSAFLQETLDHLLAQSFSNFELIISDNASTDATSEICISYANRDPRIHYSRLDTNQGAVYNFNRLISLTRGKYFKWAAADDVCLPNYLEATLERIESDPEVIWAHSQFGKVDSTGRVLSSTDAVAEGLAHSSEDNLPRPFYNSPRRHLRFEGVLLGSTWCADIFGLIRKSVLDQCRLMPGCYGAEKVLLGELALRGKYQEVPETLFYQRIHSAAAGGLTSRKQQEAVMTASRNRRRILSTRLQLLSGHARSIWNVPMTVGDRARCLIALFKYVTQFSKWPNLLWSELFHRFGARIQNEG